MSTRATKGLACNTRAAIASVNRETINGIQSSVTVTLRDA